MKIRNYISLYLFSLCGTMLLVSLVLVISIYNNKNEAGFFRHKNNVNTFTANQIRQNIERDTLIKYDYYVLPEYETK